MEAHLHTPLNQNVWQRGAQFNNYAAQEMAERNQAFEQVCAFYSPESGSLSRMPISSLVRRAFVVLEPAIQVTSEKLL